MGGTEHPQRGKTAVGRHRAAAATAGDGRSGRREGSWRCSEAERGTIDASRVDADADSDAGVSMQRFGSPQIAASRGMRVLVRRRERRVTVGVC